MSFAYGQTAGLWWGQNLAMNRTRVVLAVDDETVGEAVLIDHEQAVVYTEMDELPEEGAPVHAHLEGEVYDGVLWRDGGFAVVVVSGVPGPYEWIEPEVAKPLQAEVLGKRVAIWRDQAETPDPPEDDPSSVVGIVRWVCYLIKRCR